MLLLQVHHNDIAVRHVRRIGTLLDHGNLAAAGLQQPATCFVAILSVAERDVEAESRRLKDKHMHWAVSDALPWAGRPQREARPELLAF